MLLRTVHTMGFTLSTERSIVDTCASCGYWRSVNCENCHCLQRVRLQRTHVDVDVDVVPAVRERGTAAPPSFRPCLLWPRSPISASAELLLYSSHHITSHWDDRCRPRRPLYPRNKCLSYEFILRKIANILHYGSRCHGDLLCSHTIYPDQTKTYLDGF